MVSSGVLASIKVRHIIFHDVPKNTKGSQGEPTLAEAETDLDAKRSAMLKDRLIKVLGARSAYPIEFDPSTSSVVPTEVRQFTAAAFSNPHFVTMSRKLAQHLYDKQDGTISAGLLCVIDVAVSGHPGLALLKLEREQGAELQWKEEKGKRAVQMSVLDNLVLTDGTRLFKSALFVMKNTVLEHAVACDSQHSVYASHEMAHFWLKFLGCKVTEEPRVATQRWFDVSIQFANEVVTDPVQRTAIYEHVLSELNSNKSTVSAKRFAEDYLSVSDQKPYLSFMKDRHVATHQFTKDNQDIAGKLKRIAYHTDKGVTVTAPADKEDLISVDQKRIVVHDRLKSVVNK